MWIIAASMVGFLIDCVVGDPIGLPHPVRFIGWWISKLEQWTRRVLPQTPLGEQTAGIIMAAAVLAITGGTAWSVLWLLGRVNCWLAFAASCILCWQVLAAKCLKGEAVKVQCLLEQNDLPGARRQIAMLVGRDTQNLDGRQVAKAAIETVAISDSFITLPRFVTIGTFCKSINVSGFEDADELTSCDPCFTAPIGIVKSVVEM